MQRNKWLKKPWGDDSISWFIMKEQAAESDSEIRWSTQLGFIIGKLVACVIIAVPSDLTSSCRSLLLCWIAMFFSAVNFEIRAVAWIKINSKIRWDSLYWIEKGERERWGKVFIINSFCPSTFNNNMFCIQMHGKGFKKCPYYINETPKQNWQMKINHRHQIVSETYWI